MSDTQWPRFEVFVQEREGGPHQDYGSVHAVDAEMALLNARDVFARRPESISMWVVPAASIYARTLQELRENGFPPIPDTGSEGEGSSAEAYYISAKLRQSGTQAVIGTVEANSPEEALNKAVAQYSAQKSALVWWVFPAKRVWQSRPEDIESMFAPAHEKAFRQSTDFHTISAMRQLKHAGQRSEPPGEPTEAQHE